MVGRVEAERSDVTKGTDTSPLVLGTECVAAILDKPQSMLLRELDDCFHVERVAQCMGQHDRPRARGQGLFQQLRIDVVCWQRYVDENRNQTVLQLSLIHI